VEPFILVYDVGTSSLKSVVYGKEGNIMAKKSRFYEFSSPREGWAETDPEIWWESLVAVSGELQKDGIDLGAVKGVAITGQMHSAVLLGEDDNVLAPSILWLDRRAGGETKELQETFQLPPYKLNSSYTLPKLYWLSKHRKEIIDKVKTILWPKDYLRFRLTGEKCTDYTEGIGSALIDWKTKRWVPERIEKCGLSIDVLPGILPQETLFPIKREIAELLGFDSRCKVLVGCGDIAALLGCAPHKKGRLVYSLGSSSMYFTERSGSLKDAEGLYAIDLAGYPLFGGVSSTTGASLNWVYEQLWGGEGTIAFSEMMNQVMAEDIRDSSLLFFPFLAGERSPFWSDEISGGFEGLKLHHTKIHLTRAVMEGVAFSIRYILDLMEKVDVPIRELALSGGGAKTRGWPELIAAITGKPVSIYNSEETVTTVLFAILSSVLQDQPFHDTLDSLFAEPRSVPADRSAFEHYEALYGKYKSFLELKLQSYEL
jgi:xylulokinase